MFTVNFYKVTSTPSAPQYQFGDNGPHLVQEGDKCAQYYVCLCKSGSPPQSNPPKTAPPVFIPPFHPFTKTFRQKVMDQFLMSICLHTPCRRSCLKWSSERGQIISSIYPVTLDLTHQSLFFCIWEPDHCSFSVGPRMTYIKFLLFGMDSK